MHWSGVTNANKQNIAAGWIGSYGGLKQACTSNEISWTDTFLRSTPKTLSSVHWIYYTNNRSGFSSWTTKIAVLPSPLFSPSIPASPPNPPSPSCTASLAKALSIQTHFGGVLCYFALINSNDRFSRLQMTILCINHKKTPWITFYNLQIDIWNKRAL